MDLEELITKQDQKQIEYQNELETRLALIDTNRNKLESTVETMPKNN